MHAHEATGQEPNLNVLKVVKSISHIGWSKHAQQGRVSLWRTPKKKPKPALQSVTIRNRPDQPSPWHQQALRLREHILRETDVLEHLSDYHRVEGGILERKRLVKVGPNCLDSELTRAG
jgi:hypothetical protein